jgi:hypothetical protein
MPGYNTLDTQRSQSLSMEALPQSEKKPSLRELKKEEELTNLVAQEWFTHIEPCPAGGAQQRVLSAEGVKNFQEKLERCSSLEDLTLLIQQVQLLLHATRTYLDSESMSDLHKQQKAKTEEKAEAQKATKTSFLYGVSGTLGIASALLAAFDQTGMFGHLIPALLKNGTVVGSIGTASNSFAGITSSLNQSQITQIDAAERRIGEILYSLRMRKEADNSELSQKKTQPNEIINKISQAKSEIWRS